ncbi:hypothetical protein AB3M83_04035 [Microbacterium sp. 179-B 1A2 NHS]|uniref:hypothetical protein n=1 Tax=Microbacterium sp. 179-B 1A2 NHS TaxID=3142383 RepID=UPI00399FCE47
MSPRAPFALLGLAALAVLTGCQGAPAPTASEPPAGSGDGHGAIAGAEELAEPALHLTSIAPDGGIHHLDLVDETSEVLGEVAPVDALETDGRFLYAARGGEVSIIDSGVWTWNHVDHFHYYEAPAALLGEVPGGGTPRTVASDLGAGIFFDGGEAVLLDLDALKAGEIVERFRLDVPAHEGLVVPLPAGALVSDPAVGGLRHVDVDGDDLDTVACVDPAGSIATNVGVVVGCADGAVLAVTDAGGTTVERVPYPAEAGDRALSFAAREGRPTVAGLSGDSAFWLLDTRERAWSHIDAGEPLVRVAAVDDADRHVVALTADGAVLVIDGATGEHLARTEPLVAASLADADRAGGVTLTADQNRTYLNGPAEGVLFEIDPADGGRIARELTADHVPAFVAETGR